MLQASVQVAPKDELGHILRSVRDVEAVAFAALHFDCDCSRRPRWQGHVEVPTRAGRRLGELRDETFALHGSKDGFDKAFPGSSLPSGLLTADGLDGRAEDLTGMVLLRVNVARPEDVWVILREILEQVNRGFDLRYDLRRIVTRKKPFSSCHEAYLVFGYVRC